MFPEDSHILAIIAKKGSGVFTTLDEKIEEEDGEEHQEHLELPTNPDTDQH